MKRTSDHLSKKQEFSIISIFSFVFVFAVRFEYRINDMEFTWENVKNILKKRVLC